MGAVSHKNMMSPKIITQLSAVTIGLQRLAVTMSYNAREVAHNFSNSSKWGVAQKTHFSETRSSEHMSGKGMGSLMLGEKGKVHFEPTALATQKDFTRGKQFVEHQMASSDIEVIIVTFFTCMEHGSIFFIALQRQQRSHYSEWYKRHSPEVMINHLQARHFDDAQRRSDTFMTPAHDWARKKPPQLLPNSKEYNVDDVMYRKQRIQSREGSRNFIPEATGGDKPYRTADREPGFCAPGGLITGSTIGKNRSEKAQKSIVPLKVGTGTERMSYAEKVKRDGMDYERQQVYALTVILVLLKMNIKIYTNNDMHIAQDSSSKLGQTVPCWEEKTGCWLVAPDDNF